MAGDSLVWEPFLLLSFNLWLAGFQYLLSGKGSLVDLSGTEEKEKPLHLTHQHSKPTLRALRWCYTLTVQRVLSGSTCVGVR